MAVFQTIKILLADFRQHPLQNAPNILRVSCTEEYGPHLARKKEEVPSRGMDLSIQREAVGPLNHAPVRCVWLTLDRQVVSNQRSVFNQNGAGLNGLLHDPPE